MARRKNKDAVRELAEDIRKKIEACKDPAKVPDIFREAEGSPQDKADAFWMLDSTPGHFRNYGGTSDTGWHSTLRICRNTPEFGKRMFATFSN